MTKFDLEKIQSCGTPAYYYDLDLLRKTLSEINQSLPGEQFHVHYAVKANANPRILAAINAAKLGVDCVSGGEIRAAIEAGFSADSVVFAGVGKTDEEIALALNLGICCFNVESEPELDNINEIATKMGKRARVALRVNPNIDAHTHHYITTGLSENKFGINLELLDDVVMKAMAMDNIDLVGLHFHIGSQITTMEPFALLCHKINDLQNHFETQGITFQIINVGGGLGIDYDAPEENPVPLFKAYFDTFAQHLNLREGQELHFELGRAVVAQCGSLITQVLYVKHGTEKHFVICDAGMTDLIRPALYQAHHKIENITSQSEVTEKYDVVGPICESSDCFGEDEILPTTSRGDLLALRSAGAYGEIMASCYNCRQLPKSCFSEQ